MITDKNGTQVKLIKLSDLCQFCMCNKRDLCGKRFQSSTCTNEAEGCDGFTLSETCPIWTGLKNELVIQ